MSVWTMRFIICRIILCDWKHFQRSFVNKCVYILGTQIYKISYGLLAMKGRKKLRERRIILTNACLYMHLCTKNAATTRRNKKESKQESFFFRQSHLFCLFDFLLFSVFLPLPSLYRRRIFRWIEIAMYFCHCAYVMTPLRTIHTHTKNARCTFDFTK